MTMEDFNFYETELSNRLPEYQQQLMKMWESHPNCLPFFQETYPSVKEALFLQYQKRLHKLLGQVDRAHLRIMTPAIKFYQVREYECYRSLLQILYYQSLMEDFYSLGFASCQLVPSSKWIGEEEYLNLTFKEDNPQVTYQSGSKRCGKHEYRYRLYSLEADFQLSEMIQLPFQKTLR